MPSPFNSDSNMIPGQRPLFGYLDVGQNSISMPGMVGALAIDKPADIILGHDTTAAKIYHFGYKSPSHNIILYFLLLKHLGNVIKLDLRFASPNVRATGIIINTCGWVRGHGYDAFIHASMTFKINNLIVIGEELLFNELSRDIPATVKGHFFPKMDGVVERSRMLLVKARKSKIAEYFYGPLNQIRPHSIDMHFSEIKVYTVVPQPVE